MTPEENDPFQASFVSEVEPRREYVARAAMGVGALALMAGSVENEFGWEPEIIYSTVASGGLLVLVGGIALATFRRLHRG